MVTQELSCREKPAPSIIGSSNLLLFSALPTQTLPLSLSSSPCYAFTTITSPRRQKVLPQAFPHLPPTQHPHTSTQRWAHISPPAHEQRLWICLVFHAALLVPLTLLQLHELPPICLLAKLVKQLSTLKQSLPEETAHIFFQGLLKIHRPVPVFI